LNYKTYITKKITQANFVNVLYRTADVFTLSYQSECWTLTNAIRQSDSRVQNNGSKPYRREEPVL